MKRSVLVIALALSSAFATGCFAGDSALIQTCEAAIKKNLKAPSSYKRITVDEKSTKSTPEAYASRYTSDSAKNVVIRSIQNTGTIILETTAYIEYEASNSYGSPVRSEVECRAIHKEGDNAPVDTINGRPAVLWSLGL